MEVVDKIKLYVAIPTVGTQVDSQVYALRDIEKTYSDYIDFIYPVQCVRRKMHDFARNKMVDDFLDSGADILWFLDSDVTPHRSVLDLVVAWGKEWEVAGATYPVVMSPVNPSSKEIVFTCYNKNEYTGNLAAAHVPFAGREFVDGLATGCLFIKKEVFSKLKKPYFEFKFDPNDRGLVEGEDLGFCRKLVELGIKTFVDYNLVCKHEKEVDLLDMNNYAALYTKRALKVYEKQAYDNMLPLIKDAYTKGYTKGKFEVNSNQIFKV